MNKLAEFPLERSGFGDAPDETVIVAWPAWSLTVGDVRKAMEKPPGDDDLSKPLAYVIYGINTLGKYYIHEVKPIQVADTTDEWRWDDDCLGEYWAGNKPLTLDRATVASQEDTTPQHSVTEHASENKECEICSAPSVWCHCRAQPLASTAAQPPSSQCSGCDPAEGFCKACRQAERTAASEQQAGADERALYEAWELREAERQKGEPLTADEVQYVLKRWTRDRDTYERCPHHWPAFRAGVQAALTHRATTATRGYKLVPELPTLEMQQAALSAARACKLEDGQPRPLPAGYELWSATFVYRAMLTAAPDTATTAADAPFDGHLTGAPAAVKQATAADQQGAVQAQAGDSYTAPLDVFKFTATGANADMLKTFEMLSKTEKGQ